MQGPAQSIVGPWVSVSSAAVFAKAKTVGALAARPAHENSPAITTACGGHPVRILGEKARFPVFRELPIHLAFSDDEYVKWQQMTVVSRIFTMCPTGVVSTLSLD